MFDVAFIVRPSGPDSLAPGRVRAAARGLRDMGLHVTVCPQPVFEAAPELFPTVRAFVFHRPEFTEGLARFLAGYRGSARLIADYDALTFDVCAVPEPGLDDEAESERRAAAAEAEIGSMFGLRTAATAALAEAAGRIMGGETLVAPDTLDRGRVDLARSMRRTAISGRDQAAWLPTQETAPGLRAALEELLADYLAGSRKRRLLVDPGQAVPRRLERFRDRIIPLPETSFRKRAYDLSACAAVLCPDGDDSRRKYAGIGPYLEIAALGTVVAVSPVADMSRFDSPLLRPCADATDFRHALAWEADMAARDMAAEDLCRAAAMDGPGQPWRCALGLES